MTAECRSSRAQIVEDLVGFVGERAGRAASEVDTTADVFTSGYLSSVAALELVGYIESRHEVVLTDEDVLDERFSTIEGIADVVSVRALATTGPEPSAASEGQGRRP